MQPTRRSASAQLNCQQTRLIDLARTYLGVPFAHQGRSRRGVDCLGLLVCVAREAELMREGVPLAQCDETDYGHLPDENRLRAGLAALLDPVPSEALQPGDVAQFRIDGSARHVGLVADYAGSPGELSLIHAYAPSRCVVEHRLSEEWRAALAYGWRFVR